ncbi:MAG: hypothetical protein Kow0042_05450 [Calditrichia bacterium]
MRICGPGFMYILMIVKILLSQTDTLTIATYNILNFPGTSYTTRIPYFKKILHSIDPDVLVVQEMDSQAGVDYFLNQILNPEYAAVPFHDGPDSDNAIFYKPAVLTVADVYYIPTNLRDIAEYRMVHNLSGELLHIFSVHLKAGPGSANEQLRLSQVSVLRNYIANLPPSSNLLILGDFNFYSSNEPGFQLLTADTLVLDPISLSGDWHNNMSFAPIHTQSTRSELFGGGSSGGLDDRFDLILISRELIDNYCDQSYAAWGNDGNHFNLSVNAGINTAVPDSIADALYNASDHLPVCCDLLFTQPLSLEQPQAARGFSSYLYPNYPNPFNPSTTIRFFLSAFTPVQISVYNSLGQKVAQVLQETLPAGSYSISWFPTPFSASGVYYLHFRAGAYETTRTMIYTR